MRPSLLVLLTSLFLLSCSESEEELKLKDQEIDNLKSEKRTLMEQNLALMRQIMLIDSVKVEVQKLKNTNEDLAVYTEEVAKLQQEVRLLMRLNSKTAADGQMAKNEDFQLFFQKFMQDSSFQKSRIDFPLTYIYEEKDSILRTDTLKLALEDWQYQKFYLEIAKERTQIYDNFDGVLTPNNTRMVHWYPIDEQHEGINYYFDARGGNWLLTKMEKFD